MHISFTDAAANEIMRRLDERSFRLKLVYDAEGCGCAVSGVPALWAEAADFRQTVYPESTAEANTDFPVVYEQRHEVFFEDRLTIDYQPAKLAFQLKSSGQIYNHSMKLIDRRA